MNNDAFRSLVSSSSPKLSKDGKPSPSTFQRPAALGSRQRTSIPMTPRNVVGHNASREFALQVAEHTSHSNGEPPLKKFKSSAAPKGTKLGAGYVDRASLRNVQAAQDGTVNESDTGDKAARLKTLEEQLKLGQIDQSHFEKLKEQMGIGGDVSSTHLVKGLDWKLLERVRRGEDINRAPEHDEVGGHAPGVDSEDIDEELEKALAKQVTARESSDREESTGLVQEQKQQVLTRDEILRRFREKRDAPSVQMIPALNDKFKKVASSKKSDKQKFVEIVNGRRREVLVITNKDGTTKRKTRWIDSEDVTKPGHQPLGMEVPVEMAAKQKAMLEAEAAEDDNEDIFKDVGDDYDPLAGIESNDEQSDEEQLRTRESDRPQDLTGQPGRAQKRNYFSTGKDNDEPDKTENAFANDPTMLAALKRAAQIRQDEPGSDAKLEDQSEGHTEVGTKSAAILARLKEQERQDAADLDYGFGESRLGDEDDDEAGPLYDDEEKGDTSKKSGRKRGPKKKKGDKNNVQDVMSALESRGWKKL